MTPHYHLRLEPYLKKLGGTKVSLHHDWHSNRHFYRLDMPDLELTLRVKDAEELGAAYRLLDFLATL